MALKAALRNWRKFHADDFRLMRTSPDRKPLGRQVREMAELFWRYRYPPVQYLKSGLYLKTAPDDWRVHLPARIIGNLQEKLNPREARGIADDKLLFRKRMEAAGLPTVRELFIIDRAGMILDPDGQELSTAEAADLIREGEFFSKPIDGTLGNGAQLIRRGDDVDAFVAAARNVIVQPRIRQHPLLQELYPHSANTVRIDTLRVGDAWINNSAVLKLGVGGSIVDNGSAGGGDNWNRIGFWEAPRDWPPKTKI